MGAHLDDHVKVSRADAHVGATCLSDHPAAPCFSTDRLSALTADVVRPKMALIATPVARPL
jgi:hypothetical protein